MARKSRSTPQLRKAALAARRKMSGDERASASAIIADRVIRSHEFSAARKVACYLPMDDEVDPTRVIARAWKFGKHVYCPVIERRGGMVFRRLEPDTLLELNRYGLWEPAHGDTIVSRKLNLVITPLVAFDANGNRIGMGGGYFDRCFAFLRNRRRWFQPKLVGVAFDCQKVEKITPNPWDIALYRVISESN